MITEAQQISLVRTASSVAKIQKQFNRFAVQNFSDRARQIKAFRIWK